MHEDISRSLKNINRLKTGHIEADFCFDKDFAIFKGHFPRAPMLPGVVEIEMVRFILEMVENRTFKIVHIKKIKFLRTIVPGDHIKVEMKYSEKENLTAVTARLLVGQESAGIIKMNLGPLEESRAAL